MAKQPIPPEVLDRIAAEVARVLDEKKRNVLEFDTEKEGQIDLTPPGAEWYIAYSTRKK